MSRRQVWEVVGGEDKGGIIVRAGVELSSSASASRLSTGSLVQELRLEGERLQFVRLTGTGPASGWVSTRVGSKDLLVRAEAGATASAREALEGDARDRWQDLIGSRERVALAAGGAWHEVLGVPSDSSADAAKAAFRELSLLHHPDKNSADGDDGTFKRVLQAYEEAQRSFGNAAAAERRAALRIRLRDWVNHYTDNVRPIEPEDLAQMILDGTCMVVDVTGGDDWSLGGASDPIIGERISYMELKLHPEHYEERLRSLREEERRIVAVSLSDEKCFDFCSMLIGVFDFRPDAVTYVLGGLVAWRAWGEGEARRREEVHRAVSSAR